MSSSNVVALAFDASANVVWRSMTGDELRQIRTLRFPGVDQADLATWLGVSERTYQRMERSEQLSRRDFLSVYGLLRLIEDGLSDADAVREMLQS